MTHQEVYHPFDGLPWNFVNSNDLQAYHTLLYTTKLYLFLRHNYHVLFKFIINDAMFANT